MWKGSVGFTVSPSVELSTGMSVRQPRMRQAFAGRNLLEGLADEFAPLGVARHEQRADAVFAGRRQRDAERLGLAGEELVRDLHQDAGAVAGARIGADRAAMLEVDQDGERVVDDLVRLAALDVGDESDAAGILGERGIVKAVRLGRAGIGGIAIERARVDECDGGGARLLLPVRSSLILVALTASVQPDAGTPSTFLSTVRRCGPKANQN